MVWYQINVKPCEAAIIVIAQIQEGGWTHTMAMEPQWQTCNTV